MKRSIFSNSKLTLSLSVLFTIILALSGCMKSMADMNMGNNPGSGGTSSPGTNEVWIQGMAYTPMTITVNAGTAITWTNKDAVSHTVTSDGGSFDSGSLSTGGTFSHMFSSTGTFTYHCSFHSSMTATVVVK